MSASGIVIWLASSKRMVSNSLLSRREVIAVLDSALLGDNFGIEGT